MTIQAIIFDLDGTLLDTLADLTAASNTALAAVGLPPQPAEAYRLLVGAGVRNLAIRSIAAAGGCAREAVTDTEIERFVAAFQAAYNQGWAIETRPYPGIRDMLQGFRAAGIQLAVLSNKPDHFTQEILAHYFPGDHFAIAYGKLEGWPVKPDPALALEICRLLAVDPARTVLVGDSDSDMQTAVRAGMQPAGVLWGFRSEEELRTNGARWLASDPLHLLRLLTGGESA